MICSFDLCLDKRYINQKIENNLIKSILQKVEYKVNEDGVGAATGYVGNYKITILPDKIFLNGSLGKFYFGTNVLPLSREDLPKALKKLKKETGLPIQYARIIRIDFAVNLFLQFPFKKYLQCFEETHGYTKSHSQYGGIRYIKQKERDNFELSIYNKLSELRVNARDVYAVAKGVMEKGGEKAIMRIELRMKSEVKKRLLPNVQKLMVPHLLSRKVNQRLARLWQKTYGGIAKNKSHRLPTGISGLKELKDVLVSMQIKSMGLHQILADIDEIASTNKWTAKKKSTTKADIKRLYNSSSSGTSSHYIKEIETKIKENEELNQWIADWK